MSNISDIAKRAGVSSSTVSYVLSGKRPISEEVKQRVYQATRDLGYQPNSLARALVTRISRFIPHLSRVGDEPRRTCRAPYGGWY